MSTGNNVSHLRKQGSFAVREGKGRGGGGHQKEYGGGVSGTGLSMTASHA